MVVAFEGAGYVVELATTAEEGLHRLRERSYDLVLSDYRLPGRTGAWMLKMASQAGLLGETRAMMVSADPKAHAHGDIRVMEKPLDLDRFLSTIRRPQAPRA